MRSRQRVCATSFLAVMLLLGPVYGILITAIEGSGVGQTSVLRFFLYNMCGDFLLVMGSRFGNSTRHWHRGTFCSSAGDFLLDIKRACNITYIILVLFPSKNVCEDYDTFFEHSDTDQYSSIKLSVSGPNDA